MRKKKSQVQEQIDKVYASLDNYNPGTDQYAERLTLLERLEKLKRAEAREPLNPNTLVVVAGNLIGIGVIVAYEHSHVITTKALGLIRR